MQSASVCKQLKILKWIDWKLVEIKFSVLKVKQGIQIVSLRNGKKVWTTPPPDRIRSKHCSKVYLKVVFAKNNEFQYSTRIVEKIQFNSKQNLQILQPIIIVFLDAFVHSWYFSIFLVFLWFSYYWKHSLLFPGFLIMKKTFSYFQECLKIQH